MSIRELYSTMIKRRLFFKIFYMSALIPSIILHEYLHHIFLNLSFYVSGVKTNKFKIFCEITDNNDTSFSPTDDGIDISIFDNTTRIRRFVSMCLIIVSSIAPLMAFIPLYIALDQIHIFAYVLCGVFIIAPLVPSYQDLLCAIDVVKILFGKLIRVINQN